MLAFAMRAFLAIIFLTDIQYTFVLDSLNYESEAWNLAKTWSSDATVEYVRMSRYGRTVGLYEMLLGGIFYIFGRQVYVGMLLNAFFGTLTVYMAYRFTLDCLRAKESAARVAALLTTFYPSFIVWSSVNIRDPLYIFSGLLFLYYFFQIFSPKRPYLFHEKLLNIGILLISLALVYGTRWYISIFFVSAILAGISVYWFVRKIRFIPAVIFLGISAVAVAVFANIFFPNDVAEGLALLEKTRLSFSNLGYEDVAQSSFALDYSFNSVWDLFAFFPLGLSEYFLGPFFWNANSVGQQFALIEVFGVYLLVFPFLKGVRNQYNNNKFVTVVIMVFCLILALGQSTVISNVGTFFRHRTLILILFASYVGDGISIWWENKKLKRMGLSNR